MMQMLCRVDLYGLLLVEVAHQVWAIYSNVLSRSMKHLPHCPRNEMESLLSFICRICLLLTYLVLGLFGGLGTVGGCGRSASAGVTALVAADALVLVVAVLVLGLQAALQVVRLPRPDLALGHQAAQCPWDQFCSMA